MKAGNTADPKVYRRDIDGLRAVAVMAVIGYHAHWPGLAGGYLGVDVFFVISGYLITRLIVAESQAGRFRLGHFFARRLRRLAPALTVVLLACLLPAWWWMLPEALMDFGRSLLAVLLMAPNVHLWRSTGYFNAPTEDHPLLHTWSLGVEEQFYIGYALLMLFLWRHMRNGVTTGLVMLFLTSLLCCELVRREAAVAAFYLLPFRAWELLLGGLVAQVAAKLEAQPSFRRSHDWRGPACTVGSIGLAACLVGFDESLPHPGLWTLLPTSLTALVLLGGTGSNTATTLLRWPPLVGIGLVSYSAYLWHHPVFAFAELALLRSPSALESLGLVALTFTLAAMTWHWVEQPARRAATPMARVLLSVASGGLLVAGFAGGVLYMQGAPQRLPPAALALLKAADTRNPRQGECLAQIDNQQTPARACRLGAASAAPTWALVGDSHADALFVALDEQWRAAGQGGVFLAHNGCAPMPMLRRIDMGRKSPCEAYFSAAYDWLAARPEVTTVILMARWSAYLDDERPGRADGRRDPGPRMRADAVAAATSGGASEQTRSQRVMAGYLQGILALRAMGKQVVLVDPVPEVGRHVPNWLALQQMRGRPTGDGLTTPLADYQRRNEAVLALFEALPAQQNGDPVLRIRTAPLFCGSHAVCITQRGGIPLYYDDNHLNRAGAQLIVDAIARVIGSGWNRSRP